MADKVADMVAEMVADMEVDKMADMEVDLGMVADIDINMEIQFGERVGHGGWSIGPKLFRPEAYSASASSKLCEFILDLATFEIQGIIRNRCCVIYK